MILHLYFVVFLGFGSSLASRLEVESVSWDHLILSQFWPYSSCLYFKMHRDQCQIPANVSGWTIHGLWPSGEGKIQPQFCNKSMPFDFSQIESLAPELNVKWPFFMKTQDHSALWSHEWSKHGTCALPLSALRGEMKYFSRTLQLQSKVDTYGALATAGIVPSESKPYLPDQVFKALYSFYKKKPNVVCEWDSEISRSFFSEIYLCYDKQLNPIDCPPVSGGSFFGQCRENEHTYYYPYKSPSVVHV